MDTLKSTIASATFSPKPLLRLRGSVQDYDWGKPGSTSLVAKFAPEAVGPDFKVDPGHNYAEVWMGTHKSGPASLYSESVSTMPPLASIISLKSLIQAYPEYYLGDVLKKWPHTRDIPFLFKILSIQKVLPLQAHPDKALGAKLHKRDSSEFPDTNHKPEIAVAIGGEVDPIGANYAVDGPVVFTGFCGFRPLDRIAHSLRNVQELREAVANEQAVNAFIAAQTKEGLKNVYGSLLANGKEYPDRMKILVEKLVDRITSAGVGQAADEETIVLSRLVNRINEQYQGDVGVFSVPFFMNLIRLKRGESIYIGADEIHAYLDGDIIECMAVSDNVVNSAFVPPEQRDVKTFTDMLTYTSRDPSHWLLPQKPFEKSRTGQTSVYSPPMEEFNVLWTQLERGSETLASAGGPTIGIVTKGSVRVTAGGEDLELPKGGVAFIAPGHEITVQTVGATASEVWWATS